MNFGFFNFRREPFHEIRCLLLVRKKLSSGERMYWMEYRVNQQRLPGRRTSEAKNLKNDKRSNVPGGERKYLPERSMPPASSGKESAGIKDGLEKGL